MVNQDNISNQCNGEFISTLDEKILIGNQSQQSDQFQTDDNMQNKFDKKNEQNQFNVKQQPVTTKYSYRQSGKVHTIDNRFESAFIRTILKDEQADERFNDVFNKTVDEISNENASINLRRINNQLCFERHDLQTGKKLIGLVDLMNEQNYILSEKAKHGNILKLRKTFFIETIHGQIEISHFVKINLFSHCMNFFVTDYLDGFDLVLGRDGMRIINAKINFSSLQITYSIKIEKENDFCSSKLKEKVKIVEEKNQKDNVQTEKIEDDEFAKQRIEITCKLQEKNEICREIETEKIVEINEIVKNEKKFETETEKESSKERKIIEEKIEKENIEICERTGMDENFETNMNVKVVDEIVHSKIQIRDIIKIIKKALIRLKPKLRFKFTILFKKHVRKKSILSNVMNDFKYFEPG